MEGRNLIVAFKNHWARRAYGVRFVFVIVSLIFLSVPDFLVCQENANGEHQSGACAYKKGVQGGAAGQVRAWS